MKEDKEKPIMVHLRVPPELWVKIGIKAATSRTSKHSIVIEAMRQYFEVDEGPSKK